MQPFQPCLSGQPPGQRRSDWLGKGHELERTQLRARELADAPPHDLGQARTGIEGARPPPDSTVRAKRAPFEAFADQLVQEQRIAARRFPQALHRRALDFAVQRLRDQPLHFRLGERLQLHVLRQPVLPQRNDRVSDRLTAAHGGDHERGGGASKLVNERRRTVVEQVSIVHREDQAASACALAQRPAGAPQELEPATAPRNRDREQMRERAKRDRGRRARRRRPRGRAALTFRREHHFGGKASLADAGSAGDHHPR